MPKWKKASIVLPRTHQIVAMDCEFVGGPENVDLPARISIVDGNGAVLYDEHVKQPTDKEVVDYRSAISGVTKEQMDNGKDIAEVRQKVTALIAGKYLVGHGVEKDLKVFDLPSLVPRHLIRDTAIYRGLRQGLKSHRTPKLRDLALMRLDEKIHEGVHDSVEDARMALKLYKKFQTPWERNKDNYLDTFDEPNFPSGAKDEEDNYYHDDDFETFYGHLL